jgi:hypothetical protein
VRATAHAAAQLVQLGDAEPVGVEDDHHRRVGHVDADLDHRGGHEHVESPRRNASITASFSADGIRPCSSASRSPYSSPWCSSLEGLLRAGHLELLALLDERAHHVRLRPGGDLVAHVAHAPCLISGRWPTS